ncbi:ubiquitin-like modifier-activating enzyme ATG7 isoform X1 [Aphis gossypii]|uniref:ubiquitin-like modifier-activating enzyme ATG7 isoform X1 n=1 Tax=Aphis gossypii TaxID=80765 RepID=UPI0021591103|nr:ubiquitin-like modifier-activating enzyme ATG7 isoform X1 [Aphis gossypii]XP_050058924.1 ubiquitin-like modifier-activating enzyme ATG7 isoform X1 [Aphis gossypii]XP_050058925.1 ubiquitin-like modifier-activating enzyme ATG7 isoform X1 [Aphis gossypii]
MDNLPETASAISNEDYSKTSVHETLLRFEPLSSCLDPNFWFKVCQLKLEVDKLDEVHRPLIGYYTSNNNPYMSFDCSSFNQEVNDETSLKCIARGYCLNKNTIDSFKTCDKNELLKEFGGRLLDDFQSGRAIEDPSLIPTFDILMYTDLKRYIFYFWFAFPSFSGPKYCLNDTPTLLKNTFSPTQFDLLAVGFKNLKIHQRGFFGIVPTKEGYLTVMTLKEYIDFLKNNTENDSVGYLVFADPSDLLNNPGWPLRNLLYLILFHCPSIRTSVLKVIALRGSPTTKFSASMLFNIKLSSEMVLNQDAIKFVGWEKNSKGMFCPKYVDLSKTMDSTKQAKTSVDLNLKLMKWRIAPDLNLDIVAQSKCLIIGAGTLGCCVARNLMAWGVHNITFIDNGKVSYSNPVRQSLYRHSHCINSNTYKAIAAADVLREIHPEINSTGVVMSIPMPGHAANIDDHKNVDLLSKLIEDNDVIFLLTDSRESRWLPTMLSTLHNKLAITAALGFESYLVLRHGVEVQDVSSGEKKLGCYFCNDVTAPGNSLVDKTLDQQCTVTRPGVSNIAGALAVELFVSYIQLKYNVLANAKCCLGIVPHSIRGFISDFQQIIPFTPSFFQCIACSPTVINDFLNKKEEFLSNVFTNPNYLEDLTGLTSLKNEFENIQIFEMNDSDVEDSGTYSERV